MKWYGNMPFLNILDRIFKSLGLVGPLRDYRRWSANTASKSRLSLGKVWGEIYKKMFMVKACWCLGVLVDLLLPRGVLRDGNLRKF